MKFFLRIKYFEMDLSRTVEKESLGSMNTADKFVALLVTLVPDIVGVFVFFGAAYFSYFTFIWTKTPYLQLLFLSILLTVTLARIVTIFSHILFSPVFTRFRILPMTSKNAKIFHRLFVGTSVYILAVMMSTVVVFNLGAERTTISLLSILFASILLSASAMSIIVFKNTIKRAILLRGGEKTTWGRKQFALLWHVPALLYLTVLWIFLVNTIDSPHQTSSRSAFVISFFLLPIWMITDKFIQWIVKFLMATLKIFDESNRLGNMSTEDVLQWEQGQVWFNRCSTIARVSLVFALSVWVGSLWGIQLPIISRFTSVFFDASIILALSLILWQFISSWIERKIAASNPEEDETLKEDDEWGGAATRDRSYTLLPMIRKFIGSILVVLVSMTILSSMGVDIGPLLAGAGVIGLAIGFGAQKLVADIFSGFFYLLDDAFRVGEYLEAGTVSGTVENVTLRNVMLRHHRGMLQIVPHSELGAITNFMRGGIIVKFNLDFPYDADIDGIRKVIKKVGQEMLQNEDFGKDFIKPVKSQGVREIANSVMTIRVKFTAQPGAHFVIRREAFKQITEALSAKGIQYAHRKVIVDIPPEMEGSSKQTKLQTVGAAAFPTTELPLADHQKDIDR